MPSELSSDGSCFQIRYLSWNEEQERRWVRDLATLLLDLYNDEKTTH